MTTEPTTASTGPSAALPSVGGLADRPGGPLAAASLAVAFRAVADLSAPFAPPAASALGALADAELRAAQTAAGEVVRRATAVSAAVAQELAHRSRRELGHSGLAAREGLASPEALIQKLTGASAPEARSLVAAGALLPVDVPRADASPAPSWLAAVGEAVAAGRLTVGAAATIRTRLGCESEVVSAGDLAIAAATLLREAPSLTLEQLGIRAQELRNDLDVAGVRDREDALRDRRYLRFTRLPDGMTRVSGLLDPESAAYVVPILDAIASPRRGGPRFVDSDQVARAEQITSDPRTTEQLVADAFVDLLRLGAAVDDDAIVGSNVAPVQVLVTARELAAGLGIASLEGQPEAVSLLTAERHLCGAGIEPLLFRGDGEPLKLGRTRRRFSRAQRRALAARDGGCRFPGCSAPPSWTEAHHVKEWLRDTGLTDVDNGILLCRFHHLLVHNNRWTITRQRGDYFFVPPASQDPGRVPIPAPSKSPTLGRLLAAG